MATKKKRSTTAKRASSKKKNPPRKKKRTAAQIAATKRMIAANKRAKRTNPPKYGGYLVYPGGDYRKTLPAARKLAKKVSLEVGDAFIDRVSDGKRMADYSNGKPTRVNGSMSSFRKAAKAAKRKPAKRKTTKKATRHNSADKIKTWIGDAPGGGKCLYIKV